MNELSYLQKNKTIPNMGRCNGKQKSSENQFYSIQNKQTKTAYDINNNLLVLSIYSLIPPLRNEVKHLNFTP